jgi:hypothetical protein
MSDFERKWSEIAFALMYEAYFKHGTDGHNRLLLLAEAYKDDYTLVVSDASIDLYHIETGELVINLENNYV